MKGWYQNAETWGMKAQKRGPFAGEFFEIRGVNPSNDLKCSDREKRKFLKNKKAH